ncbi:hypothetical protein AAG570_004451 [Ranatra chinensis]|uniref:Uncharacterized protein n=1 Tax=Ranatra chinensis TaxID=642074 RepID=A0ABD0YDJ0_9HEMI
MLASWSNAPSSSTHHQGVSPTGGFSQQVPRDHLLVETRCEALSKLNRWHQAAADAELLTKLKPLWPKGYYRKAIAMARLGHYEDALLAFTLCVALDETYVQSVKHEVTKILQRLINPAMPCKMLFMRNPLTPWWSPNYMEDDATMASDILEDYNGTEKTSHPMLENRKLHHLLERISYEIENLKN